MPAKIEIYADSWSPELTYVCDFIFDEFYGLAYAKLSGNQEFSADTFNINYSPVSKSCHLHLVPVAELFQFKSLDRTAFTEASWNGLPVFFGVHGSLPFDIFAAVFYLLARVEETIPFTPDKHGRFSPNQSIFAGSSILTRPIVDEWLIEFAKQIKAERRDFEFKKRKFHWVNTFDIDVAYAYRGRSAFRVMSASLRNLIMGDYRRFFERFRVLVFGVQDPFDTYDTQFSGSKAADRSVYFFLNARSSAFDRALPLNGLMKELISKISGFAEIGIHPSYYSKSDQSLIRKEKKDLEDFAGSPVTASRQHFLRIAMPETIRHLSSEGITEEYTLGFASDLGFRCGTASSFPFFDAESRQVLPIRIHPLHLMDASLRDYLRLNPAESLNEIRDLIDKIHRVSGTFYSLWHNDSLSPSEFPEWHSVYSEMATYIAEKRSK